MPCHAILLPSNPHPPNPNPKPPLKHPPIPPKQQGQKLLRAKRPDGLEQAIASRDDPNFFRTVYDAVNDRTVVLSDRCVRLVFFGGCVRWMFTYV